MCGKEELTQRTFAPIVKDPLACFLFLFVMNTRPPDIFVHDLLFLIFYLYNLILFIILFISILFMLIGINFNYNDFYLHFYTSTDYFNYY